MQITNIDAECIKDTDYKHSRHNGKIESVHYRGNRYLVKFPFFLKRTFINAPFSEHLASIIYKSLGIPVQDTFLVYRNNQVAVACKFFYTPPQRFVTLAEISKKLNSALHNFTLDTPIDLLLYELTRLEDRYSISLLNMFYKMFVVDSFIGNEGRHISNIGIILDTTNYVSPVYDNGGSLCVKIGESFIRNINNFSKDVLSNVAFLNKSCFLDKNGHPLDVYSYLKNKQIKQVLRELLPKIDLSYICRMSDIFYTHYRLISKERLNFLKEILKIRYNYFLRVV